VEPAPTGSVITQDLEYAVKFGPLGWLLDRIVMKRKLTRTLDAVFENLVKHAEDAPDTTLSAGATPSGHC
jgi:hypothetical protein